MKFAIILLVACVAYTNACAACGGKSKQYGYHSHSQSYQIHSAASHGSYNSHSSGGGGCGPCGHGAPIARPKKISYGDSHLSAGARGGSSRGGWSSKGNVRAQAVNPISTGAYLTSNPYSYGVTANLVSHKSKGVVAYAYKAPQIKTPSRSSGSGGYGGSSGSRSSGSSYGGGYSSNSYSSFGSSGGSCRKPYRPAPVCQTPAPCPKPCPRPCPPKPCPRPCPPKPSYSYSAPSYSVSSFSLPSYSSYSSQSSSSSCRPKRRSCKPKRRSCKPKRRSCRPKPACRPKPSCGPCGHGAPVARPKKVNYGDSHLSAGANGGRGGWAPKSAIRAQAVNPISTGAYLTSNPYSFGVTTNLLNHKKNGVSAYPYKAPRVKTPSRSGSNGGGRSGGRSGGYGGHSSHGYSSYGGSHGHSSGGNCGKQYRPAPVCHRPAPVCHRPRRSSCSPCGH